jgi:hypothetical protein
VIVAVISDGAGSARNGATGATIVCLEVHRQIAKYLGNEGLLHHVDRECVAEWIDAIRDKIAVVAHSASLHPRDYAATLIAILANDERACVLHVGDGAATVRDRGSGEWSVPSWPFQGEYAATTRFVIDDPEAHVEIVHIDHPIDRFAVFSDGLERLVLDHRSKAAPADLFERLLKPVAEWEGAGRSRMLSRYLRDYLRSEVVCAHTDDDKSLILGAAP